MEKRRRTGGYGGNRGSEVNTLALLDTSGFNTSKNSLHVEDDKLAFIEAVRTASLLPENKTAPTRKVLDAIFDILNDADSLDLLIQSYQLLVELDKRFPRVYLPKGKQANSSSQVSQYTMVEEAWSPFNFGMDGYKKEDGTTHSRHLVDSSGFHTLIQEIADMSEKMKSEAVELTFLKKMLLLQYLVNVLERDFRPRNCTYRKENLNWTLLRESLLNMLLGSRKITYKGLIKDSMSIMCNAFQSAVSSEENSYCDKPQGEGLHEVDRDMAFALPEIEKSTRTALKSFFAMIMELDSSRRTADQLGLTTRIDGVRTPIVEIILDELIYDNDALSSFLKEFDPKWRLDIIVQYFQKYIKHSVHTRKSTGTVNTENFDGVLKYLSNNRSTRSIIKKITTVAIQLLLAHAYQAYVMLSYDESEGLSNTVEDVKSDSIVEVCKSVISAFACLRQEDPDSEILCCGKHALVTAAAIISAKS